MSLRWIAILALLVACDSEEGDLNGEPLSASLRLASSSTVDLGDVPLTGVETAWVEVANDGDVRGGLDLSIDGAFFELGDPPGVVPGHEQVSVEVRFLGQERGEFEGALHLSGEGWAATVALTATVVAGSLELAPPLVEFAAGPWGCPLQAELTLTNVGDGSLRVTDLLESPYWGGPEDSWVDESVELPWILAPGEQRTVPMLHVPTLYAGQLGQVTVISNDPVRPSRTAQLAAAASDGDPLSSELTVELDPATGELPAVLPLPSPAVPGTIGVQRWVGDAGWQDFYKWDFDAAANVLVLRENHYLVAGDLLGLQWIPIEACD